MVDGLVAFLQGLDAAVNLGEALSPHA